LSGELLALGVSHKTAPLHLRERLALPEGRAAAVLADLVSHDEIHEAVALSTCNRTELYVVAADPVAAESTALTVLARQSATRPTELTGALYALRDLDVAGHLFAVAAGLDSMIVGEAEIQGQVKRAYELALVEGVTGPVANRLFRAALSAGKRVRSETGVGRQRLSVASVAAELAWRAIGGGAGDAARCPADPAAGEDLPTGHPPVAADLGDRRVLVIGAGEQGELTARALRDRGAHAVFVANRRYERALELARRYEGAAIALDQLPEELVRADIVVACTASPHALLGRAELAKIVAERAGRPLVLIDIAVPRDVEPGVRDLAGVTLFDMDDLEREVGRNRSLRAAEAERARAVVDREVEAFAGWLGSLEVMPTIRGLREHADAVVAQALADNETRWESLSEGDRERLVAMCRSIVARLFHEPTMRLRDGADDEDAYARIALVRELFGLDGGIEPADGVGAEVTELSSRRRRG